MAKTKQFTIAVDNQPGAVAGIAKTIGNAKVNILSLLGTAQGTAGTVQLVVDDARRAKKALDAARIAYAETPAEQYDLPNKAGCAGAIPREARSEGRQPELHLRHRREGRQEGRRGLHRGSCRTSRNRHRIGTSFSFNCDSSPAGLARRKRRVGTRGLRPASSFAKRERPERRRAVARAQAKV